MWHIICFTSIVNNNYTYSNLTMTQNKTQQEAAKLTSERYVRVTGVRKNAFIEFDFSFTDPSIFIELVLPFDQFKTFCELNNVKELSPEQEAMVDLDKLKWRYGQPGVKK